MYSYPTVGVMSPMTHVSLLPSLLQVRRWRLQWGGREGDGEGEREGERGAGRGRGKRLAHLQLLVVVFGRVLAALALPTQFLQLSLTFLQALAFALVLHLVLLQSRLQETKHTKS